MRSKMMIGALVASTILIPSVMFAQMAPEQRQPKNIEQRMEKKFNFINASGTKPFATGTRPFMFNASGTKPFATGSKPFMFNASGTKPFATGTKNILNNEEALKCAEVAMEKREDSILLAWETYANSINSALTARKAALKEAWVKETPKDRNLARNNAWNIYTKSVNDASKILKDTRKTAHSTFDKETKDCKMQVPGEDKRADLI